MKIIDYARKDLKGSILVNGEKSFIAVTATESKTFRSMKGAEKFMAKKEYKPIKKDMAENRVWRVVGSYGRYTVALVIPEINGRDKIIEHSKKWFGFSEMDKADKLAAQLNERDGIYEIY